MEAKARIVSVVVPTQDRPALLREALQSIRALEADDVSFEIIVGDNGRSADTRMIAEAFNAVYLHTSKNGSAVARNIAMRAATGKYIAFLDDDDIWTANHIREHIKLLDNNPQIAMVVGQIVNTDTQRQPIYGPWPPRIPEGSELVRLMLSGYFPQIGATVVRACVRETNGFFDEKLIGGQDWDWQLRIARSQGVAFVAQPCVLFRQRATGADDELQVKRVSYARRIFFRHAIPEWRLWSSPVDFARSYFEIMQHFLDYFIWSSVARAERGERAATLKAIWRAFLVSPTRAARSISNQGPLRNALLTALKGTKVEKACTRHSE
jgi:glycosyltransferase involved in cell wall biosynthesis